MYILKRTEKGKQDLFFFGMTPDVVDFTEIPDRAKKIELELYAKSIAAICKANDKEAGRATKYLVIDEKEVF